MRNKMHLLLDIKIQKFTTYAPFLPLFRLVFQAKNRPALLPVCQVRQSGHFFANKKAPASKAGGRLKFKKLYYIFSQFPLRFI